MSSRFTPKGELSRPPPHIGKTIFIGGVVVFAGLSGFYLNMLRSKHRQEREGVNPIYEQVLAHANTKPIALRDVNSLQRVGPEWRAQSMTAPTKEHNAKHITIEDYKASPESTEIGRYQVPTPQRPRGDGSGRVYTKSPDYARNYEKTNTKIVRDPTGRQG